MECSFFHDTIYTNQQIDGHYLGIHQLLVGYHLTN